MPSNVPIGDLTPMTSEGAIPKERLSDPEHGRAIVTRLVEQNREREQRWAVIKGMFDGNPPYDPVRRRNEGEAWRANFNTLEGKALRSNALTPYYDLFSSSPHYFTVELKPERDPEGVKGRIITEAFDDALKSWDSFQTIFWQMLTDYVGFGRGFIYWPDPLDWKFRTIPHHRVLFPAETSVNMEEWELVVLRHRWTVNQLWNYVRDEESARSIGWQPESVRALLSNLITSVRPTHSAMDWQQQLRDSDIYAGIQYPMVDVAAIYVREFSGKWSCYLVAENDYRHSVSDSKKVGWLYRAHEAVDDLSQKLAPYLFEVNEPHVNNLSGLGRDIVNIMRYKDRLRCAQADNVMLRTSVLLQAKDASARQKLGLVRLGGMTVIPEGFEVQQSTVMGDLEGSLAVNRDLDALVQNNTGVYHAQMVKPTGNPRTAREVELAYSQATILTTSAINRFYAQHDRFGRELFRRLTDPAIKALDPIAQEFHARLRQAKITPNDLRQAKVRAMRSIGNGSQSMRLNAFLQFAPFLALLPPKGQELFVTEFASHLFGESKVNAWMAPPVPGTDEWQATQENASMNVGVAPVLAPEQDDITHARVHMQAAVAGLRAAVAQQADPANALGFLSIAVPHMAQHIQRIGGPGREAIKKQFTEALQTIADGADKLKERVAEIEKRRQEQMRAALQAQLIETAQDPVTQIKIAEARSRMQRAQEKHELMMQQRAEMAQQEIQLKDAKTASEIQRQLLKSVPRNGEQ